MYRGIGRLYEPVKADAATLAEDLIDQIARMPGGTFADTDHTLEHFREQWMPRWLERSSWRGEAQEQQREHKMLAAIDDYCRSAVARYEAPKLDEAKLPAAGELLDRAWCELGELGQRAWAPRRSEPPRRGRGARRGHERAAGTPGARLRRIRSTRATRATGWRCVVRHGRGRPCYYPPAGSP
jgi:hypothetical protein